jgi:putative hemolysin
VALNGLLAGAEIAVVSIRRTRLVELTRSGSVAARAVQRLRDDPEVFLATVQVGITVIGSTAGAFGGYAFAEDLEPLLRGLPWIGAYSSQLAFAAVVCGITYLSVVLGELVPKSLGLRYSEGYALIVAAPLLALSRVARPVVWVLSASSNALLRIVDDRTTFVESRLSVEEVRQLVEEAARTGDLDPAAGAIAARALGFGDLKAGDLMVPRRFVFSLPADASIREARHRLVASGHEQAPVSEGPDIEVLGYVTWHDLGDPRPEDDSTPVRSVARRAHYFPDAMPAVDLLRELQGRRTRLAVIVDEHGGTVGIVTLQDLLEELVGEMLGEHQAPGTPSIRRQPDGSFLVDGLVPLHTLNRELGIHLDADGGSATVGGLCAQLAGGRLPAQGEEFPGNDGTRLRAVEVSPRRVRVVQVLTPGSSRGAGGTEASSRDPSALPRALPGR